MKRIAIILLILSGFIASCKKTINDPIVTPIDPRNAVVGSYAVNGNIRFGFNGADLPNPTPTSGTITVSKPVSTTASATNTSQIILAVDFPDLKESFNAELKNGAYSVTDQKTETFEVANNKFTGPILITGQFTEKGEITFISTVEAAGNFTATKKRTATGTKKS